MSVTEDANSLPGPGDPTRPPVLLPEQDGAYLCVLASGSAGNCSVLARRRDGVTRLCLLDLGLSPRRTFALLAERGLRPDQIDDCLVTHLDGDHLQPGWRRQLPGHVRVRMHAGHARAAGGWGWLDDPWHVEPFTADFDLDEGVRVRPFMMPHDDLGVTSFRLDLAPGVACAQPASLGFATDLGRIHARLVEHFGSSIEPGNPNAVDVLAIESNYCPVMQRTSSRPEALKQRIMGGHGHLSNQEALSAILQIEPRDHVVLLHLSRDCNSPATASALHAGADYALTIAAQDQPTRWIRIGGDNRPPRRCADHALAGGGIEAPRPVVRAQAATLWSSAGAS